MEEEDIILELPLTAFDNLEENSKPIEITLDETLDENIENLHSTNSERQVQENNSTEEESEEPSLSINFDQEAYISKAREILGDDFDAIEYEIDGKSIPLKEYITDLDRLLEVIEDKYKEEKEEIKKSSINIEKLSGVSKEIVEVIAKGGNPASLLKLQQEYIEPFSTIDLDTEDGQIEAIKTFEKIRGAYSEDDIEILIEGYKIKGILEDKSKTAYDTLDKTYKSQIEKIKEEENKRVEEIQKAQKEFKKNVKAKFEELGFNDKTTKEYVTFSSEVKELENGAKVTEMEIAYSKMRQDPEKAPLLALFLKDTDKYNEIVSKKKVVENQKEISKKIFKSKTNNSNGGTKLVNEERDKNSLPILEIDL